MGTESSKGKRAGGNIGGRTAVRDGGPVRGLTTRGRCLLAGGVAAAVCAFLLDERDLLRVGIFAIIIPLLAIAVTATRRPKLEVTHQVHPDRLTPGITGQVAVSVANAGSSRARAFEFVEPAIPGLTRGVRRLVPGLRSGHGYRMTYPVSAARRGRFQVGPALALTHDVFGLWEDATDLPGTSDVLVVPQVVRLTGLPLGAGNRSASSGRAATGTTGGDPDVGVRNYRSGDDIRTIHWRASARHDELMVRLDEPVSHGGAVVLLDHRAGVHRGADADSSLELAVVLAASVSLHLLNTDHEVRLAGHQSTIVHGHDITDSVLSGLAELEADDVRTLGFPPVGSAGMVIAILGALDLATISALVAGRPRGIQGVALLIETADWAQPGEATGMPVTAARSALQAAGWRTVSIRRGDDLATAWRRVCTVGSEDVEQAGQVDPAAGRARQYQEQVRSR
ncbi:DUF58 domain-containing protein [Nakamurella sp. A5-74]|uniref:DUF58 domain-containing protein n=1 Tax=Nakamurella sp. A5-74 TaxID=3158264 RepID=A0AAU8DKE9_9ACTN